MKKPNSVLKIEDHEIGLDYPVYFVADIAANHDGDLNRAIDLVHLAAEAGANAAKFQHFKAETIVSDKGFKTLGAQKSHQSKWSKSVFEVYQDASVSLEWTSSLQKACKNAGITFFTSPYDLEIVDAIDPFVPAYKIGSGDITWIEMVEYIASKGKPYILASGASSTDDVYRAVNAGLSINPALCLMQCNTNYTANLENFNYIQLCVLNTFRDMFPGLVLGLSDHTPGHASVLGAITLGARVIEKHFTDDVNKGGPDHKFSMDYFTWKEMVDRSRELENSLGTGIKKFEENELETVILQRRAIRLRYDLNAGDVLTSDNLEVLRPCPENALPPYEIQKVIGKKLTKAMSSGEHLTWIDIQ